MVCRPPGAPGGGDFCTRYYCLVCLCEDYCAMGTTTPCGYRRGSVVVGGFTIPVDKFGLLAPYIGLASTILVATVATVVYVKRVKHRKEKQ